MTIRLVDRVAEHFHFDDEQSELSLMARGIQWPCMCVYVYAFFSPEDLKTLRETEELGKEKNKEKSKRKSSEERNEQQLR